MGKKDKHRLGQTRNNPVFKVANGRMSKQKGKAKEVTTKLKKLSNEGSRKAVNDIDDKLKVLQEQSVSLIGKSKPKNTKVEPSKILNETKVNVDSLIETMEASTTQSKKE